MRMMLLAIAGLVAVLVAGCGSSSSSADDQVPVSRQVPGTGATATAKARGPKLTITASDYGRILANGRGRALYLFTADHGGGSSCSGGCARAWPPYIVKARPTAGRGVRPGLIGTTRRDDGKLQATYGGHPVYFYEGDNEPGEVLCQAVNEFGGLWYVLRMTGKAVR